MDILIKNMELPPEGKQICLWVMHNGTVWHEDARDMIPTVMEAIPVPEHGELKDYNDILKIFDKVLPNVDDATNELLCDLLVQIMYAPTVIPSSDSAVVLERTT